MDAHIVPIGSTLIVLSVLMLFVDIFTCALICSNREDYDAEYKKKVQQQNGGAIAGTSGAQYA